MMKMPTAAEIRLAAGELTAGEMRTVKAVLQWFISTRCGEADQRDAARYRFLRENQDKNCVWGDPSVGHGDILLQAEALDAAIDAAMRSGVSVRP